jgi:S1-C subfamily serine protease
MRRFVAYGPAFVVLLTAGATLVAIPAAMRRVDAGRTQARIALAERSLDEDPTLDRLNEAFRRIADAVEPSVVHIDIPGSNPGELWNVGSSGSGWVYDTDGHVVTNAHVVRGAKRIRVQFNSGRAVTGELVGADPFTDVAVVRVPREPGLFAARRATGDRPRQGDRVVAFGSPFGFKFSMSEGIISGLGRSASGATEMGGFSNFIQTDAAVNPGNSGGPLADIRGRVIGMNNAIATARSASGTVGEGQSAGISFAIPLATVEFVADQIISTGHVSRGYLGIQFSARDSFRDPFGEPAAFAPGLPVTGVPADGPASKAGVREGDIITHINDQEIGNGDILRAIVSTTPVGRPVRVRLVRNAVELEIPVELGEMPFEATMPNPEYFLARHTGIGFQQGRRGPIVAAVVRDFSPQLADVQIGWTLDRINDVHTPDVLTAARAFVEDGWWVGRPTQFVFIDGEGLERPFTLRPAR